MMLNKILRAISHPIHTINSVLLRLGWLNDKKYIELKYTRIFGVKINWDNPTTFNEKMNWLKVYDRNPLYSILADKYAAKDFVASKIGGQYVVENYGVWSCVEDIDFEKLPNQFVFKTTHDSGGVIICQNKEDFDFEAAKIKLNKDLSYSHYKFSREWVYKNIKPRIIADRLLDDNSGHEIIDYKFWCFNGVPKIMYITNKGRKIYENFYDMDFKPIEINHGCERKVPEYSCPEEFELMKKLASILSMDIPFVRVDFFCINNNVYFGEYTFYDWAAMKPFSSYETDKMIGTWLKLPKQ